MVLLLRKFLNNNNKSIFTVYSVSLRNTGSTGIELSPAPGIKISGTGPVMQALYGTETLVCFNRNKYTRFKPEIKNSLISNV